METKIDELKLYVAIKTEVNTIEFLSIKYKIFNKLENPNESELKDKIWCYAQIKNSEKQVVKLAKKTGKYGVLNSKKFKNYQEISKDEQFKKWLNKFNTKKSSKTDENSKR